VLFNEGAGRRIMIIVRHEYNKLHDNPTPPPSPPYYLLKQVFVSMAAIIADLGKVEAESPDMVEGEGVRSG
jgi:hypothetical protein